jgi:hypothetical protein
MSSEQQQAQPRIHTDFHGCFFMPLFFIHVNPPQICV